MLTSSPLQCLTRSLAITFDWTLKLGEWWLFCCQHHLRVQLWKLLGCSFPSQDAMLSPIHSTTVFVWVLEKGYSCSMKRASGSSRAIAPALNNAVTTKNGGSPKFYDTGAGAVDTAFGSTYAPCAFPSSYPASQRSKMVFESLIFLFATLGLQSALAGPIMQLEDISRRK